MRHGSLFSGIGGFDLAAEWMGWKNVFQVENDKYCNKILEKNFLNTKRYGDIKKFDGTQYKGAINLLTSGFPCQPFSVAGKQKGKSDDRHLWPEMLRVIREVQPSWVVGENVPGIIRMELENICLALEGEGYEVQPIIIPSASIGAWDKRDRVWIIAYNGLFRQAINEKQTMGSKQCIAGNPDTDSNNSNNAGYNSGTISQQQKTGMQVDNNPLRQGLQGHSWNDLSGWEKEQARSAGQANWLRNWIEVASELCRSNARVSHRMERIKALGNSVNPYVVFALFKFIKAIEQFALLEKKE